MSRFLLVRVGLRSVGLALDQIEEIVDLGDTYAVPTSCPALRGLMLVNGHLVPVLHLASYLDGSHCPEAPDPVGVLARINGRKLCLEVDDADTLLETEYLSVPPGIDLPARAVARHEGSLIPILDLNRLSGDLMDQGASV
ncbi:MAG: chemotaxis protein CheW [Gemmatimonadales bacterium]|nr:chemotaxis protein CheW [Gemmatimonadales bacterium]